ncbi:carbamate kinase [Mycoplasmopsis adleri]|uniref:carbamate kinase n=1 Tax=Mycoplasmopsis adleri TaxID=51362 RepID=UPI003873C526
MSKIVIALGGNALGNNPEEQKELVKLPAKKIAELVKEGHKVLVGHGNGPQVGMIFNAFADAKKVNEKTPLVPFAEAGGMSQGYIGYHMLTAITNELKKNKIDKDVVYFLTQTIVDAKDKAFKNPTKPVGPFYKTKEEAEKANPNSTIVEDAGRGFRKVVPSPLPLDFVGMRTIKSVFDADNIVIAGGGGGIPTIEEKGQYKGVDGVIDKDFALSKLATKVEANMFIILTAVDHVCVNYNKPDQKSLKEVTVAELEKYIDENQFAPGSMLPKVKAAIAFVNENPKNVAIIASLDKVAEAIEGTSGTRIIKG